MKGIKKIISILLVVLLLINLFPLYKLEATKGDERSEESKNYCFSEVPEVMRLDEKALLSTSSRVDTDKDPFNSIRYFMEDGSIDTTLFPIDVKYKDSNGIVVDKSNEIYRINETKNSKLYAYGNRYNDIRTLYARDVKDGVLCTYDKYTISMTPSASSEAVVKSELIDNKVIYYNALGKGIDLHYKSTFTGFKEDIVLYSYNGQSQFEFIINTGGLKLYQVDDRWYLFEGDSIVATLGDIIIYDSNLLTTYGKILCTPIVESETYKIEIIAPVDFLIGKEVEYPVYIDPSLIFYPKDAYGQKRIISGTVTSMLCPTGGTISESSTMTLGRTAGITKGILKFPGLLSMLNAMGTNFSSASMILYRSSVFDGGSNIYLRANPVVIPWSTGVSYSPVSYTNIYNGYSSAITTQSIIRAGALANGASTLPLTAIFKEYQNGNYTDSNEVYGIQLSLSNDDNPLFLHGVLATNATYLPRITLTYIDHESEGIISGAIYKLSPYSSTNNISNNVATLSYGNLKIAPETISPLYNTSQLFKITYTGYGYTIQCVSTGLFMKNNSGIITFSATDDTTYYSTRWYFMQTGDRYYICEYFYSYLCSETPGVSNSPVIVKTNQGNNSCYWSLKLFCLDVAPLKQAKTNTCSSASGTMVARYKGSSITESQFETLQKAEHSVKWQFLYVIRKVLNSLINETFGEYDIGSYNEDQFALFIKRNIDANYPIIVNLEVPSNGLLPQTNGHYLVVKGIYKPNGSSDYYVVVNDPNYKPWNWEYNQAAVIPLSALYSYVEEGNNYAIAGVN